MAVYNPNDPDYWDYANALEELADELDSLKHMLKEMERDGFDNNALSSDTAEEMCDMVREQAQDIYKNHPDYFDPYKRAGVSESDF